LLRQQLFQQVLARAAYKANGSNKLELPQGLAKLPDRDPGKPPASTQAPTEELFPYSRTGKVASAHKEIKPVRHDI